MLQPEFVTPGVICLVAEDAPTGYILCAGAGVFSHTEIRESEGVYLGREGLSAEKVLDAWERISDMSKARAYFQGGEQTLKIFELGK